MSWRGHVVCVVFGEPLLVEKDYLTRREAAYDVARFTHGALLVTNVPSFDAEALATLLREEKVINGGSRRW
jgi:hypothetical protein